MLQNWVLRKLFVAVILEDIITSDKTGKIIMLDGEVANDTEINNLMSEAKWLLTTRLYKVLTATLKKQAQQKMFNESKSWEDMIAGKMMLHSVGVIENIIKILTKP